MNIILIGFKSSGKSSVGIALSQQVEKNFIDIDELIAQSYGQKHGGNLTYQEVYLKLGDAKFRQLEKKVIAGLSDIDNSVIAAGGGSVCDLENVAKLQQNGKFIYLFVTQKKLKQRIRRYVQMEKLDDKHPVKNFEESYLQRDKIYRQVANVILDCKDMTVKSLAAQIAVLFS